MEDRLVKTFNELVVIDSESKEEGKFHEFLIKRFGDLGLRVLEDDTMKDTQLGGNNLLFTLDGNVEGESIFFSAHTDTVKPGKGIVPVVDGDFIRSEGATILAADDKAGIAIMIELIEQLKETNADHTTLEFILTPGEEIGLIGAAAFDMTNLKSHFGVVLDNGGPAGSITVGSPTLATIEMTVTGVTAHAGLEPEKGVSAITVAAKAIAQMKLGRINENTTANIGVINGGAASNIVAEHVQITAEARSIIADEFQAQVEHMRQTLADVAGEMGAEYTFVSDIKSQGYYYDETSEVVKRVSKAIEDEGITPRTEVSGGGSDANIFNARGKEAVNISIGYGDIHTNNEYVSISEMKRVVDICKHLVKNEVNRKHAGQ